MELDEVEPVHAEVVPASIRPGSERLGRVLGEIERHAPAHLRGDEDLLATPLAEELADYLLAPAVTVDVGGVDERHARVDGGVERAEALRVVDLAPIGAADRPRAETDRADISTGLAEPAVLH